MADESFGERTEAATPHKREESRKQGQVARSHDLVVALMLLGAVLFLGLAGQQLIGQMGTCWKRVFAAMGSLRLEAGVVQQGSVSMTLELAQMILPFALCMFALAALVNLLQTGFIYAPESLQPKLEKLDPLKGLQRIFSLRAVVRLGTALFKIAVIGLVLYTAVAGDFERIFHLLNFPVPELIGYSADLLHRMGLRAAIALLILAILDYLYQRWQYEQELRMTKQEVRDELKRLEGDPKLRERRRAIQRQMAMKRMMKKVPEADVVITNPTHLAVALQYDDATMEVPKCVAKGADHLAQRIRAIAAEHGIPIVEKKPLARALYESVEVGAEVPPKLYAAVAEVLAYVYQLTGRKDVALRGEAAGGLASGKPDRATPGAVGARTEAARG